MKYAMKIKDCVSFKELNSDQGKELSVFSLIKTFFKSMKVT